MGGLVSRQGHGLEVIRQLPDSRLNLRDRPGEAVRFHVLALTSQAVALKAQVQQFFL